MVSQGMHDHILGWFRAGLAAVDPYKVTLAALRETEFGSGRLVVLAVGKAAVPMAKAAVDTYGDRIDGGLVVAKQDQITEEVDGFRLMEASHPIPDDRSVLAGEAALDLVSGLGPRDTVIALISGGGSALLECPMKGVSLMDMQITTELLMYAGAGIYELNTVRRALSAIKGGGLRRAIGDARCITMMLSDVLGNDPAVIASGPTIPSSTHRAAAWQVIEELRLQDHVPQAVQIVLTEELPPAEHPDDARDVRRVIADNRLFVHGVAEAAMRDGLSILHLWDEWRDDARELAHRMLNDCRKSNVDVLIGGGEATSRVVGNGKGGRNTETALVAAMELQPDEDWVIASLASDGDDGNSGAAGAIVDATTINNGENARAALAQSNAAGYLENMGALVVTGQTGTNVNDVYLTVRRSALAGVSR